MFGASPADWWWVWRILGYLVALVITIADQGKGFDPDSLPDPLAPENILRGTGRGIFMIRAFMDEVHFRPLHPGTELTMVKHLGPVVK